ncbi:polysaccharide biosynthesis C-terminal domain-containing protein [Bradyrhizobium sp. NP1]|uniref:polysaccharide biosynthesis C-terminal domain-containing protein n=1 Tax=Bradyrhizobium sp. NP1 TaxID=3049772 RepID=UPI0025A68C7B|nr:polysaccharide biosynthesis C-terminal domain-containing protein [Bradyrhizobium sp. NP1]WJR77321.1 polysaccharide biosynthesis C-terminal domain-containing protein [Bradyrhizobium sp. NP1]
MDYALKHSSATVKETAHEMSIPTTQAAAVPLRAHRVGGALWERLWRLAFGQHMIALVDQAIVSGASFASTVIVARWTVPSQLGIYSIGISLLVASVTIQEALISLPYTIQRHHAAGTPAESAGSSLMQSGLLSALVVLVLGATSVGMRAGGADPELATMVLVLALMAPFTLLREFGRRFAFAHLRSGQAALLDGAVAAIQLGTLFWLGMNDWMSSSTACLALGGGCAPTVATWLYLSRRDFSLRLSQLGASIRESWTLGKWLFGSQIALLVQGYAANWLLAWIAGAAITGIFAACMSVVSIANPLILGISNILVPRAVLALNEGGGRKLWRQSVQDAALLGLAMAAFCIAVAIGGERLMPLLYHGAAFENRGQLLTVLAVTLLASSLGMPATNALASMKRTREIFWIISGAAILTTLIEWHLTRAWGLDGAAYGFMLGNFIAAAARWIVFYVVLWSCDAQGGVAEKAESSSRVAQAMQVLREFKRETADDDWSVRKLDEGEQAVVFLAEFRNQRRDVGAQEPVIIKLYKSSVDSRAELAGRQFECLSRSHALLDGRTFNGWGILAPRPLHLSRSPLALVMTRVPGSKVSSHFRAGGKLTREIIDTAPQAVVAAMTNCWAAGQSHGDLNVDNILLDPVTREISFVDLDLPPIVLPFSDGASRWRPATDDLAYMLYSAAMPVKRDVARPGVRARKLMFTERVMRLFVETIAGCEDKMRVLAEIHACARLHLKAIDVSWSLQGYWRRLLRRSALNGIETTLERLTAEAMSSGRQSLSTGSRARRQ